MINKIFTLIAIIYSSVFFGQVETCDTPQEDFLADLNSITKCTIEKHDDKAKDKTAPKSVAVVVSTRRRVIRKRNVASGINTNANNHKINAVNSKNNITKNLSLEKTAAPKIIGFNFVEEIPVFKKCKNSPILEQKSCFKKELSSHVKKNLIYPQNAYDKAIQGRVLVYFTINNDGTIGEMKIRAPYKGDLLGNEAQRIIKKLPEFQPAKHNGNNVAVRYSMPISFKIPGVKPSNIKPKVKENITEEIYTFNNTETIPLFKACSESNNIAMNCYNTELVKHIEKNFAYPQSAVDNNTEGTVRVSFVINKKGHVVNVEAKGPQDGAILETAARILVQKLPKFSPATKNGKPVNTSYTFPVNFTLQ